MNDLLTVSQAPQFQIPLKDGSLYPLPDNELTVLKSAYPKISVDDEVGKMIAWCVCNPSQRKTKRGILRFVNGWLNRANPSHGQAAAQTQRSYATNTSIADQLNDDSWAQ